MSETLERIIELPATAKVGILGASIGAICAIYYFAFFAGVATELDELNEASAKLKVEVAEKQRIAASLPKFEEEVARLDVELNKALAELPDQKEIPALLEKIADKAKASGLDVKLFKPRAEQKKDFYAEVPVEIEVGGSYHQIASFFDEVGHLERIVNIDEISMIDPKKEESGMGLTSSLVATSFRFLDESERPKEDASQAKRRRKSAGNDE